jgi:hypothetical protein
MVPIESSEPEENPRSLIVFFAAAALLMGASVYGVNRLQNAYLAHRAAERLASWPEASAAVARVAIEKYGAPDASSPGELRWLSRPPWKRIVVSENPARGPLELAVSFPLDSDAENALREFGRGVTGDAGEAELIARGDSEALDILALNLADDIAIGAKTPAQARQFYDKARDLAASGKSTGYTAGLLFESVSSPPRDWGKEMPY